MARMAGVGDLAAPPSWHFYLSFSMAGDGYVAATAWQGTGTWHERANASEKIDPFPGRLVFFATFCYFSCVLFGGIEKFRIFANG